jgi:hypothetical protein
VEKALMLHELFTPHQLITNRTNIDGDIKLSIMKISPWTASCWNAIGRKQSVAGKDVID